MKGQEACWISEQFIYIGFRIMKDVHECCYSCTRVDEITDSNMYSDVIGKPVINFSVFGRH
jgi:hypothetical protein